MSTSEIILRCSRCPYPEGKCYGNNTIADQTGWSCDGTEHFPTSESLGDPALYQVLNWHIERCAHCRYGLSESPPEFGRSDTRHCQEYYDIAQEYSDYEVNYASKGNP